MQLDITILKLCQGQALKFTRIQFRLKYCCLLSVAEIFLHAFNFSWWILLCSVERLVAEQSRQFCFFVRLLYIYAERREKTKRYKPMFLPVLSIGEESNR